MNALPRIVSSKLNSRLLALAGVFARALATAGCAFADTSLALARPATRESGGFIENNY
jgi:hypothetical protein